MTSTFLSRRYTAILKEDTANNNNYLDNITLMCVYVIHKFFPTNLIKLEDLRTFPFLSLMHFFKDLKFPLLSKQMLFNEFNFNMGRFIFSYLFEKYYKTFILPLSVRNHNFHYASLILWTIEDFKLQHLKCCFILFLVISKLVFCKKKLMSSN